MRSPVRKAFVDIGGEPLLLRTVRVLAGCRLIEEMIVALHWTDIEKVKRDYGEVLRKLKVKKLVVGGSTRTETVERALRQVPARADLVAIHDAARPFVEKRVVAAVIRKAWRIGAAVVAVPVKETVKETSTEGGFVGRTLQRSRLWLVQTPQVFRKDLIREAYCRWRIRGEAVTDDSQLVEALGERVAIVEGNEGNFKITTPYDLKMARLIAEGKSRTLTP